MDERAPFVSGGVRITSHLVRRGIGTTIGVRSWDGCGIAEEQEAKGEDGVGNIYLAIVVSISRILASDLASTGEQVAEGIDAIRDVYRAINVAVAAEKTTMYDHLNCVRADLIGYIAHNQDDLMCTHGQVNGRLDACDQYP